MSLKIVNRSLPNVGRGYSPPGDGPFRLAVIAPNFGHGVVYACSRCPENYLDLTSARELIGYEPAETVPDVM